MARSPFPLVVVGLGLLLTLVRPYPAEAHAELRKAIPEPGAVLDRSPDEISLTFSEPLRAVSTFVVFNRAFETVPGLEPQVVVGKEDQLLSAVPLLPPDIYTVQWNVVGQDGHPSSGSYSFEVSGTRGDSGTPWLPGLAILALLALSATLLFLRRRTLVRQR